MYTALMQANKKNKHVGPKIRIDFTKGYDDKIPEHTYQILSHGSTGLFVTSLRGGINYFIPFTSIFLYEELT